MSARVRVYIEVGNTRPGTIGASPACRRLPSDWGAWVCSPEDLGAEHADEVHEDQVEDHRLSGRGADTDGSAAGVVPVVAADEHDRGRHKHRLDEAEDEVRWILELPEDQEVPTGGNDADLLDDGDIGREERTADPR